MNQSFDYDLIVIGSGPAGQKAAIQAAKINKKVAIIERGQDIGGVAVHTGTIPSKTLREAAMYLSGYDQRGLYGQGYRLKETLTMDDLMQRVAITIKHEVEVMAHQLHRNGVSIIQGSASFTDCHCIQVEDVGGQGRSTGCSSAVLGNEDQVQHHVSDGRNGQSLRAQSLLVQRVHGHAGRVV